MVKGFEKQTKDLTPDDLKLIDLLLKGFRNHIGKEKTITSSEIVKSLKAKGFKIDASRLRKYVNYIRCNSMAPICSNSTGYWWSINKNEISDEIISLNQRAAGIKKAAEGLYQFLNK
jgi:hypothetical protein